MESPEPVSRVAPPTITVAATSAARVHSQIRTGRKRSTVVTSCGIVRVRSLSFGIAQQLFSFGIAQQL
jgi:hypothetical protein